MKKLLIILCLCSLLLAFAGCSDTAPVVTETSTATQETTAESTETTAESIETPPESTETTAESMETTPESTAETTLETTAKPTSTSASQSEVIESHPITNDAGKYTGVVFTFSDGSTYTWTCPVESVLPIVVSGRIIEYYIGNGEWLFDEVDVLKHTAKHKVLYRHKNDEGFRYTFGTFGDMQENGYFWRSEDGKVTYDRGSWEKYDYSLFKTNTLTAIREVIPLHPGDTLPQKTAYSHVFTTIPTNWVYDETDFMYYEKDFPEHPDYYFYVRRLSGLDVLYYSEEPIEDFSAALAKELFPETHPARWIYGETYNSYDGHSKIYCTYYTIEDGDYWADDPRGIDTEVMEKFVAIVQLDAHYFAKVEVYLIGVDETRENLIMPVIWNLMYFNE